MVPEADKTMEGIEAPGGFHLKNASHSHRCALIA